MTTRAMQRTPRLALVAAVLLLGSAATAEALLPRAEVSCRTGLAKQTRRYLERVHRVRQRCLRKIFTGRISPATDCVQGVGDDRTRKRVEAVRNQVGIVLPKKCAPADLELLGFPGTCPQSGVFDVTDLETCLIETLDREIGEMLDAEFPPAEFVPGRLLRCITGVGRHGAAMVRREVRAREKCLLEDEQSSFFEGTLTCREPMPPWGEGTGSDRTDRRVVGSYIELLSGVPSACATVNIDPLGYEDHCEDVTGGRFGTFDLKLCLFDQHRESAGQIVEVAFPSEPVCGDGQVQGDEECDDGNEDETDACLNDCTTARCGDGAVQAGVEECDDGNTNQSDACLNDCTTARCGDGQVRAGVEECDDGNTSQNDPCLNDCRRARCGDGVLCTALTPNRCTTGPENGPEVCDDGNTTAGDGCDDECGPEFCGDGVVQTGLGEECDNGAENSNTQPDACRTNCKLARCGDGVVDSGESCDPPDGTSCGDDCAPLLCGNGVVDEGEACDDGEANSDTQPDACRTTCTLARCGDGVVDPSNDETCDDGNTTDQDACLSDCTPNLCGDGIRNPSAEDCDDGNTSNQDACLNDCSSNVCGDGFVNTGVEACDDGNTNDNDPCLADCSPAACGDGIVCSAVACTSGPGGGQEECDNGSANSDTAANACRTNCASAFCGDGVVDTGEDCDGEAGSCPEGGACGSSCLCANECPGSGELTIVAGDGIRCTGDEQCAAGSCIQGRCRSGSRLDTGMTGLAHESDVVDQVIARGFLDCGGSFPCGVCDIVGLDPSSNNCRCANDNRAICDEPFEADSDDCGGEICNCYFGPPLPLSSGNTPACVVNRFAEDIFGTADVDTGSGEITTRLRSLVYLGEQLTVPCPYCTDDLVANDGARDGICVLGPNEGQSCDSGGVSATFPPPEGEGLSLDCFPNAGKNVSGAGLRIELTQKTGASSLSISGDVICGFPPIVSIPCWCLQCSGDPSVSCTSNDECAALGIGTCTSTGGASRPAGRNGCDGDCVAVSADNILGQCDDAGPNDRFCDAIVRASGEGYVQCQQNADCEPINIGIDAGACTLSKRRLCFLDPIIAEGNPDPTTPIGAAVFCIPPTANPAINTVAGIPGPGRVFTQVRSRLFCANDPGKDYTPGVGGCAD